MSWRQKLLRFEVQHVWSNQGNLNQFLITQTNWPNLPHLKQPQGANFFMRERLQLPPAALLKWHRGANGLSYLIGRGIIRKAEGFILMKSYSAKKSTLCYVKVRPVKVLSWRQPSVSLPKRVQHLPYISGTWDRISKMLKLTEWIAYCDMGRLRERKFSLVCAYLPLS